MKAWQLSKQAPIEQHPLDLVDLPIPTPKSNEIRLKVLACGVCRTDIHIAEGDLPLHTSPIILGHEVVGVVDTVGKQVTRFTPGDIAGMYWLHHACGRCKYCLTQRENYCPHITCTGWDAPGGFAEYVTVPAAYAVPLNGIKKSAPDIAPLMCPGIAAYAAFMLTGAKKGDRLGLYGYGPTAYYALKIALHLGIAVYVSSRSPKNLQAARQDGALWAANTATEPMPCRLDAAILFPPAGGLVEPVLAQLNPGATLVMAPVSASPIRIDNYSTNFWGRDIRTLYNLKHQDAEGFFALVNQLDLAIATHVFPFDELPNAMILAKQGRLSAPNAVLRVAKP